MQKSANTIMYASQVDNEHTSAHVDVGQFPWAYPPTVVYHLSTHPFKYVSQLNTHFLAKKLGFKIY
jgi:hypothetical protein